MYTPSLASLRQTPQPGPMRFLRYQPGCWVQYFDDTPAKDPWKALSSRTFDIEVARHKQLDRCGVCFSLQAFGSSRTKEELISFRNLGVDIDLVAARERAAMSREEIDRRKEQYLRQVLLPFPLKPHWLIETRHGMHAVFRVMPRHDAEGVSAALGLNARLVRALHGDGNAVLLTQVLRVPGTLQFKAPEPFLCRLLLDYSGAAPPYGLEAVRAALDAWEVFHAGEAPPRRRQPPPGGRVEGRRRWREGLGGVAEGARNATAASLAGKVLACLPEELWGVAGWGALLEWNRRNVSPLPEPELRRVLLGIARRESARRARAGRGGVVRGGATVSGTVRVEEPGGPPATPPDGPSAAEDAAER